MGGKRIAEDEAAKIVEDAKGKPGTITKLEKKEEREQPQLLYDLTSLQRHANTLYGFSARRTLGRGAEALRGAQGAHLPAYQLALPDRRHGRRDQADRRAGRPQPRSTRRAREYVLGAGQAAARPRGQRQEGHGPPRDHPDQVRARPVEDGRGRAEDLRPRRQALPGHLPPRRRVRAHPRRDHRRRAHLPHQRPPCWSRPAGAPSTARRSHPGRGAERRLRRRPAAAQARAGRGRGDARGRVAAQGDPAAAALHRGLAARRDGDRRQGHRGRGAARGHEGLRHRHAGHARLDHRAPDLGRLHRARRPRPARHREGRPGDPPARRARAHLGRADRRLGARAWA